MTRILVAVLLLLLSSAAAFGQYHNGYTTPGGYVYRDGYWYHGSQAYTRTYVQPYYIGTYYYPGYFAYYAYYPPQVYTPPAQPYIAQDEDAFYQKTLSDREKHKRRMDFVAKLGYDGTPAPGMPFAAPGYGGYGYSGHLYNYQVPVNGNTQYGYSTYNQIKAQQVSDVDMGLLYQYQFQLTNQIGALHGRTVEGFKENVAAAETNRSRVAEIDARAKAIIAFGQAIGPPPTAQYQGYKFEVRPQVPGKAPEDPAPAPAFGQPQTDDVQELGQLFKQACSKCHTGKEPEGKFDVTQYLRYGPEIRKKVWDRISLRPGDPAFGAKMMPRGENNGPGTPLTEAQLLLVDRVNQRQGDPSYLPSQQPKRDSAGGGYGRGTER